jgi:hypothetical protein
MSSESESSENKVFTEPDATRVVVMTVNPSLLHVYWQISQRDLENIHNTFHVSEAKAARPVLRFYDITCILFDGKNAHSIFDVEVDLRTSRWNVPVWGSDKSYVADLGYKVSDGGFYRIARSNVVNVPRAAPSHRLPGRYLRVEGGQIKSLLPLKVAHAAVGRISEAPSPETICTTRKHTPKTITNKATAEAERPGRAKHPEKAAPGPSYFLQGEQAARDSMPKKQISMETSLSHALAAARREKRDVDLVQLTLRRFSLGVSSPNRGLDS